MKKYICANCGSDNIEIKCWMNPNTLEWESDEFTDCFCFNCDEQTYYLIAMNKHSI